MAKPIALTLWLVAGHGIFDRGSPVLLVLVLTLYWLFGLSAGPVWNAWIVGLLRPDERPKFFSKRGPYHEISVLFGLMAAGGVLSIFNGNLLSFIFLFVSAGIFRLVSAYSLYKTPDELPGATIHYSPASDFSAFFNWLTSKKVFLIIALISMFNFGVFIASPFFTPYMLKQMGMGYSSYMFLIAIPFLSRAISYRYFESIVKKRGLMSIILPAMLGITLVPVAWAWFPHFKYLIAFQIISGIAWTGFEYGILLKQISEFAKAERSRVLVWTNFFVGIFSILGALLGSYIIGEAPTVFDYIRLFEISTAFRFLPVALLFFVDWTIPNRAIRSFYLRLIGVRIGRGGVVAKPMLYTEEEHGEK